MTTGPIFGALGRTSRRRNRPLRTRTCAGWVALMLLGQPPALAAPAPASLPPGLTDETLDETVPDPASFQVGSPSVLQDAPWGWRLSTGLETRSSRSDPQWPGGTVATAVLDSRHEWTLDGRTRFAWSNRLEWSTGTLAETGSRHALREAYVSRDLGGHRYLDAGRIQLRSGVALGWNPTDWLRANSVGPAQQSPTTARENRIGAVMLRAQQTGASGTAELAVVPRLRARKDTALPDWGWHLDRGNDARAVFARISPRLSDRTSLDLSALSRDGQAPGWGIGLSTVVSPRWLAWLEGQWQSRAGLAGPGVTPPASRLHARVASGLSVTLDAGAVLSAEWHRADDALDPDDWRAWRDAAARSTDARQALATLRADRARQMDPLVRDSLYLRLQWNDALRDGQFDLSGFVRLNPYDHSRWWQLDGAWHLRPDWSLRLTLASTQGATGSEHGSRALRHVTALTSELHF